jgi:hypothetical protein
MVKLHKTGHRPKAQKKCGVICKVYFFFAAAFFAGFFASGFFAAAFFAAAILESTSYRKGLYFLLISLLINILVAISF